MFNFIFNAADALLLLNFILSCLMVLGAWYFRSLLNESLWFIFAGAATALSIFMVFSYFQESVYQASQHILDSPILMAANLIHFLLPLVVMTLFRRKLQCQACFTKLDKIYLAVSALVMMYFMYRFVFADFYLCPSMEYCKANQVEAPCSERTFCAVRGLYGLASVLKFIFVGLLIKLWLTHKHVILNAHWSLRAVLFSYGVYWTWRSVSAILIVSGVIEIESSVGSLLLLELCCAAFMFIWFVHLVSAELLAEHSIKVNTEQNNQYKLEKNMNVLQEYLQRHQPQFQKNLTLERLAQQVGISSRDLSSVINQHFQTNYTDFLNSLRIEQAKILLGDKDQALSIQVIFSQIGFNSKTAFNTAFKKQTGMTPSQFRNKSA